MNSCGAVGSSAGREGTMKPPLEKVHLKKYRQGAMKTQGGA